MVEHNWIFPRLDNSQSTEFPPLVERGELFTLHCLDYDRAKANREMVAKQERSYSYDLVTKQLYTLDDAYLSPKGFVDSDILELLERRERKGVWQNG